jgi:hypothetical protein
MQIALAEILLNGNLQHSTVRVVSAPEVLILRDIHGGDAVINVAEPAAIERTNAEEIDRLKLYYGAEAFSKVYPGSMPKLPTAFAEVGVEASKEANKKAIKADKVN